MVNQLHCINLSVLIISRALATFKGKVATLENVSLIIPFQVT